MRNKKYLEKFNAEQILKLNQSGLNLKQISEIIDIPTRRLGEMCKQFNLDIKRNTKNVNETFFDNLDSEIKFYLLGYFIADGCMIKEAKKRDGEIYSYSYRFTLLVSIDDLEVIKYFNKYICPNSIIKIVNNTKGAKNRKQQVSLRWVSRHMFETLESYNIHPRKTYDSEFQLPENILNHKYTYHLIRGLVDGDGHINNRKNGRYISICVNSENFGNQILQFFQNTFKTLTINRCKRHYGKTTDWWTVDLFGGRKLISEYREKMYSNSNFYLTRKYDNTEVISETKESETPQSVEIEPSIEE